MKRNTLNYVIDAIGFVAMAFLVSTGAIMRFVLPSGSGYTFQVWGMDRHAWGHVHFWLGVAFLVVVVAHILLHWGWIVSVTKGSRGSRAGSRIWLAVIVTLAVLALAAIPLLAPAEKGGEAPRRGRSERVQAEAADVEQFQTETTDSEQTQREAAEIELDRAEAADVEHDVHGASFEYDIHGSMTLRDIEELSGVPATYLLQKLGLSPAVSIDERLGRLRRTHGFEIDEVRAIVESYHESE